MFTKNTGKALKYCGKNNFRGGSIFVEFVGTSHPRVNILHELLNKSYKFIFPFVGIN